jgi:hypothetical protein
VYKSAFYVRTLSFVRRKIFAIQYKNVHKNLILAPKFIFFRQTTHKVVLIATHAVLAIWYIDWQAYNNTPNYNHITLTGHVILVSLRIVQKLNDASRHYQANA